MSINQSTEILKSSLESVKTSLANKGVETTDLKLNQVAGKIGEIVSTKDFVLSKDGQSVWNYQNSPLELYREIYDQPEVGEFTPNVTIYFLDPKPTDFTLSKTGNLEIISTDKANSKFVIHSTQSGAQYDCTSAALTITAAGFNDLTLQINVCGAGLGNEVR